MEDPERPARADTHRGDHAKSTRAAIDSAAALGDADTADLFTGVSRGVDELLWKVEAHNAEIWRADQRG